MTVLLIEVELAQASAEPRFETLEHRRDRRVGLSVLQRLFVVAQTDGERHALVACFYLIPLIEVKNLDGFDEVERTISHGGDKFGRCSVCAYDYGQVALDRRKLGKRGKRAFSTMPMAY